MADEESDKLTPFTSPSSSSSSPSPSRRAAFYSQPLLSSSSSSSSHRSAHRKHSLDDDRPLHSTSSSPPFFLPNPNSNPHLPPPHSSFRPSKSSSTDSSLTLDMAMSAYGGAPGTLPEFTAGGGGKGVFQVPIRAAMHPNRPPCLELRPHPLRETQAGSFLRALAANEDQLWAASESGLRMWDLSDIWAVKVKEKDNGLKKGDEESAVFHETGRTAPVMCMEVDRGCGVVWSGHKDGKVRSWKLDPGETGGERDNGSEFEDGGMNACSVGGGYFKEGLSWQAHAKTPVLSMAISSYGEIWTGSEGGAIRVWPWDAIQKSLSLTKEEKHMAALLVERSYVDLRNQVTINGVCPLPASDVKYIVADKCKSKVWTASTLIFVLWDARTRTLLKVFDIQGQTDQPAFNEAKEMMKMYGINGESGNEAPPPVHETQQEDESRVKLVSSSKKEKKSTFLQRSRNAIMGAADAVRRVATKGTFVEDNRRIGAISVSVDGTIWTGFTNGSMAQWDGSGTRLHEIQHHTSSVQSICPFTDRLWVGYASGIIHLIDLDGALIGQWVAHSCPVIHMAVSGSYLFSLGHHGGVRGWSLMSPGPVDDVIRDEMSKRELVYTKNERIRIMAGTWNVGQEKAGHDSLISWLGSAVSDVGLVVVGLQEVDMGAGFLALSAAKETVGLEGSPNGEWWLDSIGRTLDEGTTFQRVGSRQLAGLLIGAWARKNHKPHIGDVDAAAIPTGIGRALGNKGAVGLRMRVYDRTMCFVNSHFAAHLEAVNKRNADFDLIYRNLSFSRPSVGIHGATVGATSVQLHRAVTTNGSHTDPHLHPHPHPHHPSPALPPPDLSESDLVVFMGDFNYRLHSLSYDEAREMVSQRCFDWLRDKDQLRAEMRAGKVFQGMREAHIKFPPTYKFQRHQPGLGGYDSGEKKRIPAWCDRILYRDSRSISVAECSLECPVVTAITHYDACMDVTDSDHKPVRCKFRVEIARADELIKRQEYGKIIHSNEKVKAALQSSRNVPKTVVSMNTVMLQNQEATVLKITNKSESDNASYKVVCEGQWNCKADGNAPDQRFSKGSFGFPLWIEVNPATGMIKRGSTVEITIRQEDFEKREEFVDGILQNWWCEDIREKEATLLVIIMGANSADFTTHRIHVKHNNSAGNNSSINSCNSDKKFASSRRFQPNQNPNQSLNQNLNQILRGEGKQMNGSDLSRRYV